MPNKPDLIVGHSWDAIQRAQRGGRLHNTIRIEPGKDYGSDPLGNGMVRMVPSGDVVDLAECRRRLG